MKIPPIKQQYFHRYQYIIGFPSFQLGEIRSGTKLESLLHYFLLRNWMVATQSESVSQHHRSLRNWIAATQSEIIKKSWDTQILRSRGYSEAGEGEICLRLELEAAVTMLVAWKCCVAEGVREKERQDEWKWLERWREDEWKWLEAVSREMGLFGCLRDEWKWVSFFFFFFPLKKERI